MMRKSNIFVSTIAAIAATAALCLGLWGCTTAAADHPDISDELNSAISTAILSENEGTYYSGECPSEGHVVLGTDGDVDTGNGEVDVYALASYSEYEFENGNFVAISGSWDVPVLLTFTRSGDGSLVCTGYTESEDGNGHVESIRRMFPAYCQEEAINPTSEDSKELDAQCKEYAAAYLNSIGREAAIGNYGDFDRTLLGDVGVSAQVCNKLTANKELSRYPLGLGTCEWIEDGVRYIYETTYDSDAHLIVYEKREYDTGVVVQHLEFDSNTGDQVSQ